MTTSSNFESLVRGFDRDWLPKAFQDAADIARRLGVHYLWIDTLCIVQDSDSDWQEEAAKMGGIFENAALTIVASSIRNPKVSIFTDRRSPARSGEIGLVVGDASQIPGTVFRARQSISLGFHAKPSRAIAHDALDICAWALQERELATRFISFTGAELQWRCRELRACECCTLPYPTHPLYPETMPGLGSSMQNYRFGWIEVVEEYTSRKLTVAEDKLPALTGLASKFQALTGFTYVGGLWREQLLSDLAWQRDSASLECSSIYLGPTFSWVSIPGHINFRFARHSYPGRRVWHSELIHLSYVTGDGHALGKATECSMTLRGPTISLGLRSLSPKEAQAYQLYIGDRTYSPNTNQRTVCEFAIDTPLKSRRPEMDKEGKHCISRAKVDDYSESVKGSVKLLALNSIYSREYLYQTFLILGRSPTDIGKYERIGVGSGKIYYEAELDEGADDARSVKPFEWLASDIAGDSSALNSPRVVEEVICVI